MPTPRRIFISVAENSADAHAARLVRLAQRARPHWTFRGLTGPQLRAAGVPTVYDFTARAAMLTGALKLIGRARQALAAAEADWRARRPDLVVVMDSSALHLPMARRARRLGLPVFYYIAPQTWASRSWRNRRLRDDVDHVASIIPFEADYLRRRGVRATFVGHPLFEALAEQPADAARVAALRGAGAGPLLALLPGSREHVIRALLPLQAAVVRQLRLQRPVRAAVSCVSAERVGLVRGLLAEAGLAAEIVVDDNASLLTAADLVLVASGTATLHTAHYRKPMVVLYDAGRWLYWPYRLAGRLALRLPHLAMINILAQARIVPEFMPFVRDPALVARLVGQLLDDRAWRELMVRQIDETVAPLESARATDCVLELLTEQIAWRGSAAD